MKDYPLFCRVTCILVSNLLQFPSRSFALATQTRGCVLHYIRRQLRLLFLDRFSLHFTLPWRWTILLKISKVWLQFISKMTTVCQKAFTQGDGLWVRVRLGGYIYKKFESCVYTEPSNLYKTALPSIGGTGLGPCQVEKEEADKYRIVMLPCWHGFDPSQSTPVTFVARSSNQNYSGHLFVIHLLRLGLVIFIRQLFKFYLV